MSLDICKAFPSVTTLNLGGGYKVINSKYVLLHNPKRIHFPACWLFAHCDANKTKANLNILVYRAWQRSVYCTRRPSILMIPFFPYLFVCIMYRTYPLLYPHLLLCAFLIPLFTTAANTICVPSATPEVLLAMNTLDY